MLYTEEGLYLEWKVVSSRIDTENQNLQTNQPGQHCSLLAWVQTPPSRRTYCFTIFYFCMQVPSL